jgi:hypothetical protein
MTKTGSKKSLAAITLCTGIIFPAAFLFSLAADLPHVLMITLLGLFFSFITRKTSKLTDRTVIYSVVISITAAVLFDYIFPMDDDRFEYLSSLFRLNITVPVMFYLAVAVTFFNFKKYSYAVASVAAVIALAFGGNVMRIPVETKRFLIPGVVLNNFILLYIMCIISSMFFMLLALRNNVQVDISRKWKKYRFRKHAIFIILLALIFPATLGFYRLFVYFENELRGIQNILLNPALFKNRRGNVVFGQSADLNQIISPEMLENQKQIVIRAISKSAPGYLRGKAYSFYMRGRWEQVDTADNTIMRQMVNNEVDYNIFTVEKDIKAKYPIEILISSNVVSKVLFMPGNFTQVDIIASSLQYTENGNVSFKDWIADGGYTVYRTDDVTDSAWPKPVKPEAKYFRQVPEQLSSELDNILASLPALKKQPIDDQKRIFILLKYFKDNFSYKIRKQPDNPIDPVLSFLNESHEGHCELYATSMILLLRHLGIPARYVTGFICSEKHPMGDYYVARLGNAHAWVEAFDRDRKQWILVEPTPPSGIPDGKGEWSTMESWWDLVKKIFQKILSDMRRGYFARAIIDFFVGIWRLLVLLCWHPFRGPIVFLLLTWITVHYVRRWKKRRVVSNKFDIPDEVFVELGKAYRQINRELREKYELNISDSSTINEFIKELAESDMAQDYKEWIIKLLREYESMRYQKNPPSTEVYLDFKKRFHL